MQAYDASRFDPPAPLALVMVRSERPNLVISDVPMLLDTGADVSLLPLPLVSGLISADAPQYELEAFDGSTSKSPSVTAELQLLGKSFRGQFLVVDNWHGVLGRNILNNLSLLLRGPDRQWMEQR
jgi:hypothetical protein